MPVIVSTAELSTADRVERWHEAVTNTFIPLGVDLLEEEPSPGDIVSDRLGVLRISRVEAGPQTVTRSSRLISGEDQEFVILTLQERGTAMKEQDGRQCVVRPGEFSLSDSSRAFRKTLNERFAFTSFHFPREVLSVRPEDLRSLTATTFTGAEGSSAVLAQYVAGLARVAADLDDAVGRQLAVTALDLLALLIDEHLGRLPRPPSTTAAATVVRVKDHIMRNLGDPDLSPRTIAAVHFVSVRYLHKLFEQEGTTVAGWIRAQRLERCRRDLLRPRALETGVAVIARRWGFVSAAHFSRAFRDAYGMTPREWQVHGLSDQRRPGPGMAA
ncbi:helix-turn-helix domain-containing protein [Streptomyces sp. NPDC004658]|uniref:AraC-like ligand-binding domain-containing protein n=1 Tax=Streptomyces sp. NPDC004658 TaxID=3154672 RepID=UPI0033B1EEE8